MSSRKRYYRKDILTPGIAESCNNRGVQNNYPSIYVQVRSRNVQYSHASKTVIYCNGIIPKLYITETKTETLVNQSNLMTGMIANAGHNAS